MIIASAGHVDHGKTALLQAITGINADRLPEEKARGMTIDLGYAYWPQPDGRVIGFIDVPGHEKFLANMLSGTGGLDHSLVVVAADDGVMPQTREHLTILQLNGQPPVTVVITKADRADGSRLLAVEQQIRELTTRLGWPDIPLFVTSVVENRGISELATHLSRLTSRSQDQNRPFRLAIDRAFNVKGTGTVVTGTALGGRVSVGDKLWLTGMDKAVRVRGLHAQNQPAETACGGQRVALNITGGVEKSEISRGDWLLENQAESPTERLVVALTLHQPLQTGQPLHIHHAASHITGRVSVLEGNLAELRLDSPLFLADNDRLILRDIAARQTLAGARVVLLTPKKRGKRQPEYLHWLHQLATAENDAQALALYLVEQPCRKAQLAWARQLTPAALSRALEALNPVEAGHYLMLSGSVEKWQEQLLSTLSDYHQHHGDRPGLGRDRLRRMALPNQPEEVGLALIDLLRNRGGLSNNHGWLHLPAFSIDFLPAEAQLWQRAEPLLSESVWWIRDMARELGVEEEQMRQTFRKAAQRGAAIAVVKDRYFSGEKMKNFAELIRQRDRAGQSTSAADFRDQLAVGRKLAIQILEFFDRSGFTRRKGNEHLLRDADLFS